VSATNSLPLGSTRHDTAEMRSTPVRLPITSRACSKCRHQAPAPPMIAASGGYEWRAVASGEAIPGWIERARRNDPDLWVVELDIPDAARFVAETLAAD